MGALNFAPNLLTVTIWAFSEKGAWLGIKPEILTGHPMFTRVLRRSGSDVVDFPMLHLSICLTRWAFQSTIEYLNCTLRQLDYSLT